MKELRIGNVRLAGRLILAPMVDVTDVAYRLICRKAGAALAYTEMLNIGAILHTNRKTQNLMKIGVREKPVGIQITGPTVRDFKTVVPYLKGFDLVDINCGCPSIRTLDNSSGAFLMKSPLKIARDIRILKDAGYIVTAKIRLGFKNNNVLELAKAIEKAGADALTVHARLAHDSYKVPADWKWIAQVKNSVGIPVIGNGDIMTGKHAVEMLDIADGAMIARAAIGDPLVFSRMQAYLRTGKEEEIDVRGNLKLFQEYLLLAQKYDVVDIPRVKSLGAHFLKGFNGASEARAGLMMLKSVEEIREFVGKWKER